LLHQLEEARSKAESEAERSTKAEDKGYCRGFDKSVKFFQELLVTLAPDAFCIEGYFEAYVKDRRRAQAEGQDPEFVEFTLPATNEDGLGDEETMPLDSKAVTLNDEGDEVGAPDSSDHDEHSDAVTLDDEGDEVGVPDGSVHDEDPDACFWFTLCCLPFWPTGPLLRFVSLLSFNGNF